MDTSFSILSFNTHGRPFPPLSVIERYQILGVHCEQVVASTLCLQEVWSYTLLSVLQRHLPSYPYCAYKHGWLGPQAGLVIFSQFPLGRPSFVDIPPVAEPRKKLWINRVKRATKRKGVLRCTCMLPHQILDLWNVYLVANGDGDWSETGRYYQAHLHDLTAVAEILVQGEYQGARMLAGDFNISKESQLYHAFVQRTQVRDVFGNDQTPTFQVALLAPGQQAQCIDYLFLDAHPAHPAPYLAVRQRCYLFQEQVALAGGRKLYLSDHVGLWAEIAVMAAMMV